MLTTPFIEIIAAGVLAAICALGPAPRVPALLEAAGRWLGRLARKPAVAALLAASVSLAANALIALAQPCTYWLNGSVLFVDGGEAHSG